MKKVYTQVIHNLKKDKGSFRSFGIIMMFTALMLNVSLVLWFQVDKAYDEKFLTLNAANINICIPKVQDTVQLKEDIVKINGVYSVECREVVLLEATVKDFRDTDFTMNTIFYNLDYIGQMNQLRITDEKKDLSDQAIYIPLYVSEFGQFQSGDWQRPAGIDDCHFSFFCFG